MSKRLGGAPATAAFDQTYAYDADPRLASTPTAVGHATARCTYVHRATGGGDGGGFSRESRTYRVPGILAVAAR